MDAGWGCVGTGIWNGASEIDGVRGLERRALEVTVRSGSLDARGRGEQRPYESRTKDACTVWVLFALRECTG